VGPLCGPPLRLWVLCGVLSSVLVPCGWAPPLPCSRFPWHLFLVLPLARARALAVFILIITIIKQRLQIIRISAGIEFAMNGGFSSMSSCTKTPNDQISHEAPYEVPSHTYMLNMRGKDKNKVFEAQTVYNTTGTRAHTHRELIRKWLWEPKGSSLEYI